jgi:flagellar basal body-associated protein FliL
MPDPISSTPTGSSLPTKKGGSKGLIIAIIVIVVLAALAYLVFGMGGGPSAAPSGQPATNTNSQNQNTTPTSQVPNEVYSYVGAVTAVGNGQITVLAKKDTNLLDEDTTLTVKADANTQVISRTIPKVLPTEGGAGLFTQKDISVSDIKVGDQVTVVSSTNVKGVTTFTASRIEVLNVQ